MATVYKHDHEVFTHEDLSDLSHVLIQHRLQYLMYLSLQMVYVTVSAKTSHVRTKI